jgi:hypothetical protein
MPSAAPPPILIGLIDAAIPVDLRSPSVNPFANNGPAHSIAAFGESTGTVDPSGYVLAAVGQARDAVSPTSSATGTVSIGAGLGIDVSLHVLPAVGRVAAELKATLASFDSQLHPALALNDADDAVNGGSTPLAMVALPAVNAADAPPAEDPLGHAPPEHQPALLTDLRVRAVDQPPPARRSFADQLRDAATARRPQNAPRAMSLSDSAKRPLAADERFKN